MPARPAPPVSQRRRSSDEVRTLVEDTARRLFAEHGFEEVSTRRIAQVAGVTQAAIFRHFGTKEGLFAAVALQPLTDFCEHYERIWSDPESWQASDEERTERYVRELSELVRQNRPVFAMLASHLVAGRASVPGEAAATLLDEHLSSFARILAQQGMDRATTMDLDLAVRFTIALVLGMTLYGDVLVDPHGQQPGIDLDAALAGWVLRGAVLERPPPRGGNR